jgi:hypothetical protein
MANRFFDDVVSKSIEFNLGFVNKVFINNNDKDRQDEEQTSSQIIEIKSLNGTLPIVQKKIKARPLFRGISDSITRGDLVLFSLIAEKFYYIGPLNTFNEPNYSNSNFYSLQLEDGDSNLKDNIDPSSGYGSEYHSNILITKLQKSKNKEMDLLSDFGYNTSKHSDLLIEGRHGNGIRVGSKALFPILNISNNNSYAEESLVNGSLISLLSNGSIRQNFNLSTNFLLSVDIFDDVSNYVLNKGNDGDEEIFNYNFGELDNVNSSDQILITSDKITFDARSSLGDFTVSSNRNINFGAKKNFTLNNSGYSVINSGNIYLGEPAKSKKEPVVLGDELRKMLEDITKILKNAHALVQGVPTPLVDKTGAFLFESKSEALESPILTLTEIAEQLKARTETEDDNENINYGKDGPKFLSHHHYIEQNNRSNNEG